MQVNFLAEILYTPAFKPPWMPNVSCLKLFKANLLIPEDRLLFPASPELIHPRRQQSYEHGEDGQMAFHLYIVDIDHMKLAGWFIGS